MGRLPRSPITLSFSLCSDKDSRARAHHGDSNSESGNGLTQATNGSLHDNGNRVHDPGGNSIKKNLVHDFGGENATSSDNMSRADNNPSRATTSRAT